MTVGIVVAIVAVVLVSRVADEGGGRAGLGLALLAGSMIGLFSVFIAQVSDGHVFGPLSIVRGAEALLIVAVIVVTRSRLAACAAAPARAARDRRPRHGRQRRLHPGRHRAERWRSPSVVSSLYPVTTVILATVVLHERVTRSHAVGIGLAALAIVLIGAGST